jgi:hypothetical protein
MNTEKRILFGLGFLFRISGVGLGLLVIHVNSRSPIYIYIIKTLLREDK